MPFGAVSAMAEFGYSAPSFGPDLLCCIGTSFLAELHGLAPYAASAGQRVELETETAILLP